jgi:peptidoglycan-associated lipoprotein
MKKLIFTSILAATLIALTGCGKTQSVEPTDEEATTTEQTTDEGAETAVGVEGEEEAASYSGVKLPAIYFDFDKFDVRADPESAIFDAASAVGSAINVSFRIEGNCDEWGTEEYNYALGLRRAKSVQDALIKAGVNADQLTLISYGESNPVCAQSNSACWRQNRRVEVTVLP